MCENAHKTPKTPDSNRCEPSTTRAMNEDIRICFNGDSFVNGTGDDDALGWVGRVCAAARRRGVGLTAYNLGIRRDTSLDVLARCEQEWSRRLPAGVDGRIVLSFGVNDTVVEASRQRVTTAESCDTFRRIADAAAAKGARRVLFVGPPPVAEDDHNARIEHLVATLFAEADELRVPRIDLFTPLRADENYRREIANGDGAHPTAAGYARIAEIVLASPAWWFR
jgi:acyl-CoA thioesterase-1